MTNPTICDIFELLDKWRHLPDYQLERRADIYFAMFLPDVLEARYGPCEIIPEFPRCVSARCGLRVPVRCCLTRSVSGKTCQ